MQLVHGNLMSRVWMVKSVLRDPGPVPTPGVHSAVLACITSCFIVETASKSQRNAVLAINSAGEREEKNFPKLRAGLAASEFGALSSLMVGGKEGRKINWFLPFLSSLAVKQTPAEPE